MLSPISPGFVGSDQADLRQKPAEGAQRARQVALRMGPVRGTQRRSVELRLRLSDGSGQFDAALAAGLFTAAATSKTCLMRLRRNEMGQ